MEKQKHHNMIKIYISFFAFCAAILLIGVVLSVPIKVEIHSVGEKPPFLFALLFLIFSLVATSGMAYASYLYWFDGAKARTNLESSIEKLAKQSFIFRLPIYKPTFLFWYIRFITPILTILLFGLFLLVLSSAF